MTASQRKAIDILMAMDTVTVGPSMIADALGMNVGVLRKHVRDGDYHISKVDVCGDRIRFFRKDFLQQIGELAPDPPERTDSDRLEDIIRLLDELCDLIHAIAPGYALMFKEQKTAGAATPTD